MIAVGFFIDYYRINLRELNVLETLTLADVAFYVTEPLKNILWVFQLVCKEPLKDYEDENISLSQEGTLAILQTLKCFILCIW